MKYVNYVNSLLREVVIKEENLILYGQNIDAGSCLSGLTSGLGSVNKSMTLNTTNSENTLVGIGFGLMLNNISSVFFMKQMDFLLLGIDHLVNTYNVIRQFNLTASFTIFPISVDSGYEGPQSALNNLSDFCSIADIEGFSFTNKLDTEKIIHDKLVSPGFRILSPSQKLLREDTIDLPVISYNPAFNYFQYLDGLYITIICFNFSIPYGVKLANAFAKSNKKPSLFSVNSNLPFDVSALIENVKKTRRLVFIDDSKSVNKPSHSILNQIYSSFALEKFLFLQKDKEFNRFSPNDDQLDIDYEYVTEFFK